MRVFISQFKLAQLFIFVGILLLVFVFPTQAQREGQVEVLNGHIELGEIMHYNVPDLKAGDILYVYMTNASGNLDPTLLLSTSDTDTEELRAELKNDLEALITDGVPPTEALISVIGDAFLAASDNNGQGSDASFEFVVPADGDYLLLALGTLVNETSGGYQLIVSVNEPAILDGIWLPTGAEIAFLDEEASGIATAVQQLTSDIGENRTQRSSVLNPIAAGDTLYFYVGSATPDFVPQLTLKDYSGRTIQESNPFASGQSTTLQYTPLDDSENMQLIVTGLDGTKGEFRLLAGLNEPAVLTGEALPQGRAIVQGPTEVLINTRLEQITGVDQKAENYGGAYLIEMRWNDPSQAFNPDDCQCTFKTFIGSGLAQLLNDDSFRWPNFTIFNQQSNRWIQNQGMVVESNGDMLYFERFTTTLQAPDFNFRAFPFDTQQFYLRVDALFPDNFFVFNGPLEASQIGDQLGEEEWRLIEYSTEVSTVENVVVNPSSRFSFGFQANRHLNFYIMRIFVPTILIILVSYFTFFLQDYSKRIDVTSGNLLVFVAFNFTISDNLPRLGYLTFLDAMLAGVFVITALVIAFNVFLRRLELKGKKELAQRIDSYTLWLYPIAYLIGGIILYIYFILPSYWDSILQTLNLG
ncbi:MAG: hypothetical protein KDE48_07005 [Anaerolineales bacterium]|nr:hypothetical protein [Anaerolineales bacterium]